MSQLMTVRQVAVFLQVSTDKVYELAQAGGIPAIKIGQQWRFSKEDIATWLKTCSVGTKLRPKDNGRKGTEACR